MHNFKSFFDKKVGKTAFTWLISVVFIFGNFAPAFANSVSPLELSDETNPGAQEFVQENIEDFPTTDIESTSAFEDALNSRGTLINKDQLHLFSLAMPQLENRERNVIVYLPSDYHNGEISYPVIYVLDARSLFIQPSFSPEDRILNEALYQFYTREHGREVIIVGIESDPIHIWDEYGPWVNQNMYLWMDPYEANQVEGGKGDAFLDFMEQTLKPAIDERYRTLSDRENTSIAGYKMGGLLSVYAGLTRAETYAEVMAMSPAVWFAESGQEWLSGNHLLIMIDRDGVPENVFFSLDVDPKDRVTDLIDRPAILDSQGSKISFPQAHVEGTQALVEGLLRRGYSALEVIGGIDTPTEWTQTMIDISHELLAGNFLNYLPLILKPALISPQITSASSATFSKSSASSFTITTSGYPVPTISISGTLPAGITFTDNHNGTAKLAGTPTATGTYTLTITAQNGVAPNATQTFTLKVIASPLITSASSATFTKSTVSSFTITTSGYPVPTISISGTLPAGITFTDNHNGTAKLAGTPTATGTYTLTIAAQNGVAPNATQTFTLKVVTPPLITSASSVTFTKLTVSSFTITTSGYPVPTISISGTLPAGITFTDNHNGTAKLAGTPTATGTYTLTITAQNGVAPNATQTFTLKVIASPLITSASSATFTKSTVSSFTITTSGYPVPTISVSGSMPAGITFTDNHNGTAKLAGTPTATGTYTLTITAQNGVAPNATQTFTLKVVTPPLITSASSATFTKSTVSSFTITTSGYPVPTISVSGSMPAGITFTDNHNGTAKLAGTPTATGTYTLTITAQNGVAPNATQTFTLKVVTPPLITSASSATFTKSTVSSFTITTSGYPVPTISVSGSMPAGISFKDDGNGTARIYGTPTALGTYTLTITAQNGVTPNATQTFTLKVIEGCPGPGSCLITFSMNMSPYLNRTRNVAVYLPPNYNSGNYYPVIYLMDAQHMFGAQIGAPIEDNVDWKMDETLDSHYSSYGRGVIAVGIWIDTHYPWSEYTITPNPNMDHWWSGESFAAPDGGGMINFIRYVLKPEIDSRFHTLTDRDHTAIGGGSRCALLALYAGLLAKETFSRVMAMSPAVWIAESKYEAHVDIPGLTTWRTCSGVTYCNGLEWWIKHNQAPTNVRYFLYIGTSEQSGYVYPYVQLSTNPDHQIRIEYAYVDGARMVKNALISDGVQSISYIENDGGTHEPKVWRNFIIPNVLPFFEW